jgi:hypothetical protein
LLCAPVSRRNRKGPRPLRKTPSTTGRPVIMWSLTEGSEGWEERALSGSAAKSIMSEPRAIRIGMGPQCGLRAVQVVIRV